MEPWPEKVRRPQAIGKGFGPGAAQPGSVAELGERVGGLHD